MSDNSSWWLLLPCGIVTLSLTIVITSIVLVLRRAARPATRVLRTPGQFGTPSSYGSPLDATWTPDNNPAATHTDSSPASHHHWESHGHTIHHHDSGSSSSWSDSGSSSTGDSGSSHHHHSD